MLVLAATIPLSNVLMGHCEAIENPPEQEKSTGHGVHVFPSSTTPGSHIQSGGLCELFLYQKSHSLVSSQGSCMTPRKSLTHTAAATARRGKGTNTKLTLSKAFGGVFTVHFSDVLTAQKIHIYTYSVCDYNPKLRLLDCEIFFACEVRGFLQDEIFSKHARIINSSVIAFHMYKGDGVEEEIELSLPSV